MDDLTKAINKLKNQSAGLISLFTKEEATALLAHLTELNDMLDSKNNERCRCTD